VRHPHSLQLTMDSLRYWVTEMHADGFRFDLAAALAREFYEVDRLVAFRARPARPRRQPGELIAEPWDVGPGGYQVGDGEFASRITGSADLYEHSARRPVGSINFVTAHDGLTLRDLVSYNEKHNEVTVRHRPLPLPSGVCPNDLTY
jgi:isoamylase